MFLFSALCDDDKEILALFCITCSLLLSERGSMSSTQRIAQSHPYDMDGVITDAQMYNIKV